MKHYTKVEQHCINLDKLGEPINVQVRHSIKAKRIIIKIHNKNVELVLPNKNINAGYKFLLEKESWVRNKLQRANQEDGIDLDAGTIPIFGKQHSLCYADSVRKHVKIIEDVIHVESFPYYHNETLIKFLKEKLLIEIMSIASILAEQLKIQFSKIKITDSKTRWGSCSSNSVLCFNWRLIFVPTEILNYVIIHEMCHLIEMNHSKSFWNLVAGLCTEYKYARAWLKRHGPRLHSYLSI